MLDRFYHSPSRVQALRDSPGGSLLEGFAEELFRGGYAEISARRHIRAAEHLIHWSDSRGEPVSNLTEKLIPPFDAHLKQCQCPGFGHSNRLQLLNSVRSFLKHLRGAGKLCTSGEQAGAQEPPLLSEFSEWMRRERGTSAVTLYNYSLSIRDLLKCIEGDPRNLDAKGLREFVMVKSQNSGLAAGQTCATALRMFLRFLTAEGRCSADLCGAIPTLAQWRLSSLPRYLQPEEVESVISSCDQNSPVGMRDRSILLLLARMALRAGDIVRLRLGDIDWEGAKIHVSGKSLRQTGLPLTHEIGQALAAYIRYGRPRAETDVVFVRSVAPFRRFAGHSTVSVLVAAAIRRAGIIRQGRGAAHVLRHSAATFMLWHGASLQDVADVLRHRSIETTQIYAKVDVTALRQIVQPWPEVKPC